MAKQLVYTSVPKGLRAGTAGFTTVAMSPDLDPLLVSRLERLSSYPGEQVGRSGCTALRSHMVVEAGSQPVHVLACVSTAPTDYSGRSNFIAHYLILDPEERPAVGPAALLEGAAAPFLRGWEGDPRYLDDLQLPQRPARAPARCTAWEHISADPGWGGFFIDRSRRGHAPQFVIYGPDVDPITLIGESIALLAPRRRWDVTFSTMASGGASTDSCEWRWMPAGSRAASDLPVSVGRLDLTGRVGEPPPGPGVDAARSGSLVPDGSVVLSLAPERASLRLSIGEDPDSGEMENPDLLDSADACRPVFAPSSARRMVVMVALGTGTAIAAIVALVLLLVPISGPDIESDGDGQRLGTTELEQSVKAPTGLPASALTEDLSTGNEKRPVQSNAQKDPDAPRRESGWVARNIADWLEPGPRLAACDCCRGGKDCGVGCRAGAGRFSWRAGVHAAVVPVSHRSSRFAEFDRRAPRFSTHHSAVRCEALFGGRHRSETRPHTNGSKGQDGISAARKNGEWDIGVDQCVVSDGTRRQTVSSPPLDPRVRPGG